MTTTYRVSTSDVFLSAHRHRMRLLMIILCLAFFFVRQAEAAGVPVGFADRQIASGLTSPTAMAVLPDGRVLVVQQNGVIRMIKNDALLSAPFYTVQNVDSFAERGCLGVVADPGFITNRYIYIYCTVTNGANSNNRILRVTESNDVGTNETVIHNLPNVPQGVQWHMGGALRFGIDGKLYVAVGNHNDTVGADSQSTSNPFGKIIRLNPDGSIPVDNPYIADPSVADKRIFNFGLRNPFAFDIQPDTGLMYINDVGSGTFEEINLGRPRANYGWPTAEGESDNPEFDNPIYAYRHSEGCAITGGAFYNPPVQQFPALYQGKYFFADFCDGWIRYIDPANPSTASGFATGIGNPTNLGVAPDGSLYYLARNQGTGTPATGSGTVGKINFTNSQVPRITVNPQSQTVYVGNPVTFTVAADGASSYQWLRNGANIPGATSGSYTINRTTLADNQATFTAVARNGFGSTASSVATLTVSSNRFPVAVINTPSERGRFAPGDTVSYSGSATDGEDGTLSADAFTWQVDYMHDTHSHPLIPATRGVTSGTFAVSDSESDLANTWLRIYMSVQDSAGQTHSVVRDIFPRNQLSDMTPVGTPVNGKGPIERNQSNGDTLAGDGRTITLDRIAYPRGIGVHAPSDIRYNLSDACTGHFIADVGVDDSVGDQGSVVFQVFLDGVKAFDSGIMRGDDNRQPVNISLAGKNSLRLVVTDGGDGNTFDVANWGGARVTGCPPLPEEEPEPVVTGPVIVPPSGGGGCTIGGDGRFDPTLPGLLVAALALLGLRRRKRN